MGDKITHAGDSSGSVNIIGDKNKVSARTHIFPAPNAPSDVNVREELEALKAILAELSVHDQGKLERAIEDAEDEAKKEAPDKDEIGEALSRVTKYSKDAEGLSASIEKIGPRMVRLVSWLGPKWNGLLEALGVAAGGA